MNDYICRSAIIVLAFVMSMILSSVLIKLGIPWLKRATNQLPNQTQENENKSSWWKDLGFWIGFFETLIIFVFVVNKEYSGLALIFGAKEFVRKEEIQKDPTYYLLGTVINFAVTLVILEIAIDVISISNI